MAADIVADYLSQMQECIVIMDDYGHLSLIYIPANSADMSVRASTLAAAQAQMQSNQAAYESYAAAIPLPLPTPMTSDQKRAQFVQSQSGQSTTMTVTQPQQS